MYLDFNRNTTRWKLSAYVKKMKICSRVINCLKNCLRCFSPCVMTERKLSELNEANFRIVGTRKTDSYYLMLSYVEGFIIFIFIFYWITSLDMSKLRNHCENRGLIKCTRKNVRNLEEYIRLNLRSWTQNCLKFGFHLLIMRFSIKKKRRKDSSYLSLSTGWNFFNSWMAHFRHLYQNWSSQTPFPVSKEK